MDANGNWIKHYSPEQFLCYHTRSSVIWYNMVERCSTGSYWNRRPTYIGTVNGFKDFQEFANWCQDQYGYMNKECNGNFWSLDKDLKIPNCKLYSKDTCMFVPNRINILLNEPAKESNYPVGVNLIKRSGKFRAQIRDPSVGKKVHIGQYNTADEARLAYVDAKISAIKWFINNDWDISNHKQLVGCLEQRIDVLSKEFV